MLNNEKLIDALNELVYINYDRIFGYERASEEVDVDFNSVFVEKKEIQTNRQPD